MIRFELLDARHDRRAFSAGVESLDRYLRDTASQSARRQRTVVVVAVDTAASAVILGYYAVSPAEIHGETLPEAVRKRSKLPAHAVGATLIGRLAVDARYHGRGLGGLLLANALYRAFHAASWIGSAGVIVDALDERAALFYEHFGFLRTNVNNRLVLPIDVVASALSQTAHGKSES